MSDTEFLDSMNNIYTFKDTIRAVLEMLDQAREERDSLPYPSHEYNNAQIRVEAFEDVVENLTLEQGMINLLLAADSREQELEH
jgi:hypothetical protein